MRRKLKYLIATLVLIMIAITYYYLNFTLPPQPELPGQLYAEKIRWDGQARTYTAYVPSTLSKSPELVFIFHGSKGDVNQARISYGYEFERLAERYGFIVVYPQGFEKHFNGCRKEGPYSANILNVDDVGFVRKISQHYIEKHKVNSKKVFATGLSNGGHMAIRLALEAPDLVAAVAPVAASLPRAENMDCSPSGTPVAFMLMNGTKDPINPFSGGEVSLFGQFGKRGKVISSYETVRYWVELAKHTNSPEKLVLPDKNKADNSIVTINYWREKGLAPVTLYSVIGGGHNLPHPIVKTPRLLGPTNKDFIAAEEIWMFFKESVKAQ